MRRAALIAPLLFFPLSASAQVLITEVQNDPTSANDDGEWVELQNIGTAAVNIGGWSLSDFTGTTPTGEVTTRWTFPANTTLNANQVIVVAKFASATGYADNTPAGLYAAPPSFECATAAHDDMGVPNLTAVGGTAGIALGNATTGDAIVLRDNNGALVSGVEYGTVDRSVPGLPAIQGGSASSLRRVANTGSSLIDFAIATTPDPFVGFTVGGPTPPVIAGTTGAPRHLVHNGVLTISATITDAQGVASATAHAAAATSTTGSASAVYGNTAMTSVGRVYSAAPAVTFPAGAPATFHERYVRYWVGAQDTNTATASDPARATTAAANTAFYWRNVIPATPSTIAEIRTMSGATPRYRLHSARVEGVALTRRVAFVNGRTNFFIQTVGGGEAIRVFSSEASTLTINPGDVVRVTGMIDQFNGLRQIGEPSIDLQVMGTAAVPRTDHTIADITTNGEALESQLVRVRNVVLNPAVAMWPSDGNVTIDDGTGTLTVRVSGITDLAGTMTPSGSFDITGVLGQFSATNVGGYQLLPRGAADVSMATAMDAGVIDAGGTDGGVVVSPDATPGIDAAPTDDAMTNDDAAAPGDDAMANDDAAAPADDAMATNDDAMATNDDAAAPGGDAAPPGDGGMQLPSADATPRDATTARDAAAAARDASAGISQRDDSGCGCETTTPAGNNGSLLSMVLFVGAFVWMRRRGKIRGRAA